jgi:tRNA-modifying protein YgfZ
MHDTSATLTEAVKNMSVSEPIFMIHPCPHLSCFEAKGADAKAFLQSQLTQDVNRLDQGQAALAGYCTAQGRLLASMVLHPASTGDSIFVLVSADLQEALLKRLRMFVLRSKVTLEARPDVIIRAVSMNNPQLAHAQSQLGHVLPDDVWHFAHEPTGTWIKAPSSDADLNRYWWIATENAELELTANINDPAEARLSTELWRAGDIQAGLPWIEQRTQDLFIPQTVNLDLTEGVSFTKGCYPGQEVVARAHYRGTVKRRMHLGQAPSGVEILAGIDVFCPADGPDPCGRVINSALTSSGVWVLFEAPIKQTRAGELRVGTLDGPLLHLEPLPYEIEPPSPA